MGKSPWTLPYVYDPYTGICGATILNNVAVSQNLLTVSDSSSRAFYIEQTKESPAVIDKK